MAVITTRAGKGAPLTNAEVDANFTNLNTEVMAAADSADIGTAPNQIPLNQYLGTLAYQDAAGVNLTGVMALLAGAVGTPSLSFSGDSNTGFWSPAADTVAVSTGGVERLRVDSAGNVGVRVTPGTWNSTSRVIQVGVQQAVESFGADQIWWRNIVRTPSGLQYIDNGFAQAFASETDGAFKWYTAANNTSGAGAAANVTQRMTLDAAGNLGLGVTPVAAYGVSLAIRHTASGAPASLLQQAIDTDIQRFDVANNALPPAGSYTGGYQYQRSGSSATMYTQVSGRHEWRTAASGTAGTAITFTQAMTLDAAGNLGLGVTPSAWGVSGANIKAIETIGGSLFTLNNQNLLLSQNSIYNGTNYLYKNSNPATQYQQSNGQHLWFVAASGTAGNAITFTEAMRFDNSGNFIQRVNTAAPTLSANQTMSFELTSNTSLKIVVRGTDGTTRSASLTLA